MMLINGPLNVITNVILEETYFNIFKKDEY